MSLPDYPWRRTLATWPVPWRQMWADRANELADAGAVFPEDERLAFAEVAAIKGGAVVDCGEGEAKPVTAKSTPAQFTAQQTTANELPFS